MTSIKSAFNSMNRIQQAGAIVGVVGITLQVIEAIAQARRATRIMNQVMADASFSVHNRK